MTKHISITITGRVQGVGFRFGAVEKAKELSVSGFVKNLDDGSVYIEAEGEEEKLNKFLAWCKKGPWWAKVELLDVRRDSVVGYQDFTVRA